MLETVVLPFCWFKSFCIWHNLCVSVFHSEKLLTLCCLYVVISSCCSHLCASLSYPDGPLSLFVDMTFMPSHLWARLSHSDGLLPICFYDSCGPICALVYLILMGRCPYLLIWLPCSPIFELEYHIAMDCYLYVVMTHVVPSMRLCILYWWALVLMCWYDFHTVLFLG
jgi:hypothetical protein